jgi:CRP-like cAMP-binding protein
MKCSDPPGEPGVSGGTVSTSASILDPERAAILAAVEGVTIFRRLDTAARASLAAGGKLLDFGRGDRIFTEGDPSRWFYFVVSGRVKIFRMAPSGREVILEIFGPGDPVGAVASFEGFPFPASASAAEASRCLQLGREHFLTLLEHDPRILRAVLSGFSLRLLEMSRRIVELSSGRVEVRLAQLFLRLAHEQGHVEGKGCFIPQRLTRQELADLCGTTIETTIRVLSRWGKEDLLRTEENGFRLPDLEGLETIALS